MGKLNPTTGQTTEYPTPILKPGSPTGSLGLRSDEEGNRWVGMYQGGVKEIQQEDSEIPDLEPSARRQQGLYANQSNSSGPLQSRWEGGYKTGTYTLRRLDLTTGKFEVFRPFREPSPNIYDVISDSQNNAYFTVFGADQIGKIDAKTGKITLYKTPTPNSLPAAGRWDRRAAYGSVNFVAVGLECSTRRRNDSRSGRHLLRGRCRTTLLKTKLVKRGLDRCLQIV